MGGRRCREGAERHKGRGGSNIKEDVAAKIEAKGNNVQVIGARPAAIVESRENSEKVTDSKIAGEFRRSVRRDGRRDVSGGRGGGGDGRHSCGGSGEKRCAEDDIKT
jgi:hypothetical protein